MSEKISGGKQCLMIVESPSKCKTLEKFLGRQFKVMASYGHVRDLPTRSGVVDIDKGFEPNYVDIDRNAKHMGSIAKQMKRSDILYLATDPDREGEAIAGHVAEILSEKKLLEGKEVFRIAFNEINASAVKEAIQHPRDLSDSLIEAQRARRILDHLVGFNLSPLLWKKIMPGLSAGRVQSPALRMIVEREEEIAAFVSREYWSIDALSDHKGEKLRSRLVEFAGKKLDKFAIADKAQADKTITAIERDSGGELVVSERKVSQRKLKPPPPYTTSTLLQDAATRLGFDQRRTMRVAQRLYEGIEISGSPTSLITYMRTDSFSLSKQAVERIREVVADKYTAKLLPDKPRLYKTKSKTSQEAHEAIRPNNPRLAPSGLQGKIGADELKLYALIWVRAVGSQMADAVSETNRILLGAGEGHAFQLSGSRVIFDGFLAVNDERRHAHSVRNKLGNGDETNLPDLPEGTRLKLGEILSEQHFTKPPPRYNVASLVEALDKHGIGRPSTYATIVSILEQRNYIEVQQRNFHPTDMGIAVSKFLVEHFKRYVDYEFTAKLEDELDSIAGGEANWREFLESFWRPFDDLIQQKTATVKRGDSIGERVLGKDPKSGREVRVRIGRYGPYAQIGVKEDEEKPLFASLPPGTKMDQIGLEEALRLFDLPRQLGTTEKGDEIVVAVGRFGPYVRFGDRFASMAEGDDPYTINRDRALELIDKRIELDRKRMVKSFDDENIRVLRSRFGFTLVSGPDKKNLPKDFEVEKLTREGCIELLKTANGNGKKNGNGKRNGNGKANGKSRNGAAAKRAAAKAGATRQKAGTRSRSSMPKARAS